MQVWFVDDLQGNRETWLASFPTSVRTECVLRTFATVPDLFSALDDGDRPDVLFVDYFIGAHDGMEVVERFMGEAGSQPLLIAHSSMARMNEGMIRGGAHLSMEKVRGVPRTKSIVDSIRSIGDLRGLVLRHRT